MNTTDYLLNLPPGFRFHPTDEELISHYLFPKSVDSTFSTLAIGDIDLNKVEPWDLPWKAKTGEKEWYFFFLRDRKYPTGLRTNRATVSGYWKATGKDKDIFRSKTLIGMKKTLVFYIGRAPRGEKTNWVMHEYRLEGDSHKQKRLKTSKKEWVIGRVFMKSSGGKKVHISGLIGSCNGGEQARLTSELPPLTEISSETDDRLKAEGLFSCDNIPPFPSNSSPLPNFAADSSFADSYVSQDQSILEELLLENNEQVNLDCLWNYY